MVKMTDEMKEVEVEADVDAWNSNALQGRELEWAVNSKEALEEHKSMNGKIIRTRFPPEPNGYLHIGHAKSMNMNFKLAFEKLNVSSSNRRTIFRYDDTNPEAESDEYIESLRKDVEWLGWQPERTTYSSDNFELLYGFAMQLIEKGMAYVCDMTKKEMEAQRELAKRRVIARCSGQDPGEVAPIPSPDILPGRNRNTSVERNVKLFQNMRRGMYDEGSYTLRLKMDLESANPNMFDLVAYRIKFTTHPHMGDGWCIYPAYDFTHGICDSLEHIDYSICTLEFETRREPYYWILHHLDLFKPKVYEMSRLNVTYTVLSKRKLLKLVTNNYVRGWDDPRMPTISGLRRRGYTSHIINSFCTDLGATRAMNVVEIKKLFQTARLILATTAPRAMIAMDPIEVQISNFHQDLHFDVANSPTDQSMGHHTITLTQTIHIDASDFRLNDSPNYYGLAPNKAVGLKYYGGNLICDQFIMKNDKVTKLICRIDKSEQRKKPKTFITWVPQNSIPCQIRLYDHLFTVPEPTDRWEEELNPNSEVVYPNALIDPSVSASCDASLLSKWKSNPVFQFERFGYFAVDTDTTYNHVTESSSASSSSSSSGLLVFNRTVQLKEDDFKKQLTKEELNAIEERQNNQRKAKELKEAKLKIDPLNLFKEAPEYVGKYATYNDSGIPLTLKDGTKVTKSATKKLEKELIKFKKMIANADKQ